MKQHYDYKKTYIGSSDGARLIVESCADGASRLEYLKFGQDGGYDAYVVDVNCEIPAGYICALERVGKGWLKIFDDMGNMTKFTFNTGIRIYRRGEFGCIIQLM